ncbi:TPA: hypothetical protein O2P85_002510 [Staphylococcus aureus]|nr:hypothetical protein [Lactococcus lactis]MVG94978.1 hypothetical protein [Staphylococcus aureus]MVI00980.1 hypothetical protein [Staphylococcus aureus]MVI25719.1 hypothetical protein [Staphylococcus aureus]MVI29799.1 hypothetical protein [Staphylococcus aureus]
MKYNKSLFTLFKIWCFTFLISGIVFLIQEIVIIFASEKTYLPLLFERNTINSILVISLIVTIALSIITTNQYVINYIKNNNVKTLLIFTKLITYAFCVLFVLATISTVTIAFLNAKNVDSISGKVDKVQKVSSNTDGTTVQVITVEDSSNNKLRLYPSKKLKNFDVNKNDNVKIDYLPSAPLKSKANGTILGYSSVSK